MKLEFELNPIQVCPAQEYQRKLHPDDLPLRVQQQRRDGQCHFIVRKNPNYPQKRQVLLSIVDNTALTKTDETTSKKQRYVRTASCQKDCVRELSFTRFQCGSANDIMNTTKLYSNNFCTTPYNPVYNIREICAVSNSFSSIGVEYNNKISQHLSPINLAKRHSVANISKSSKNIAHEAINNNSNYAYV